MPVLGTRSPITVQVLDYSAETKTIQGIFGGPITEANYDDRVAEMEDFVAALDPLLLAKIVKTGLGYETVTSDTPPTDKTAQIETEMLVTCRDAVTNEPCSFRISGVDYAAFNYGTGKAGDEVIIAGAGATAATLAFVTAVNTDLRSPFDSSHFVIVRGMRIVK